MGDRTSLSVIIPIYNEEKNLTELYHELSTTLKTLTLPYEVIFVDDGSSDNSYTILKDIAEKDKNVKLIRLARNYGQTVALSAGIKFSSNALIITMDGDLQNDPRDIPKLLIKLQNENYDIVSGWRKKRRDPLITRKLPSEVANWFISKVTGAKLHDYGCTLKIYKREYLENISIYGEMHRLLPAYCFWAGARIGEIEVNHRPRIHGRSKYGLERTIKVILDVLVVKFLLSYLNRPIYVYGGVSITTFLLGTAVSIFVVIRKIFFHGEWLSPLFFVSFLLWTTSIISLLLGLLAEVLSRLYFESSKFPTFVIKEKVNL
jgi:glycosyltransferase involved in cell wall biosynthesis